MADPEGMDRVDVNVDALKSEIRRGLINQKVCVCACYGCVKTVRFAASWS